MDERAVERLRFGAARSAGRLDAGDAPDALMRSSWKSCALELRSPTWSAPVRWRTRARTAARTTTAIHLMAMMPSFEMAARMPARHGPLPVLKVLYRNARFLSGHGRDKQDALEPLASQTTDADLVQSVRARDLEKSEQCLRCGRRPFASESVRGDPDRRARRHQRAPRRPLLARVRSLARHGQEQSLTMLRQSFASASTRIRAAPAAASRRRRSSALLPELMAKHALEQREVASTRRATPTRALDDAF